jgi:hypothetical protein
MTRKSLYNALITLVGILLIAGGSFAQGKHGGDKGGDRGNRGGGQENRSQRGGDDRGGERGNRGENRGNRGNDNGNRGNGWGRQKGGDDQRAYQQQRWQQNDQARQQGRQPQQNEWNARQQQQYQQQALRQQQEAYRRQAQQQYQNYQYENRGDRGKHKGWNEDGPRGNAYGQRNIWPGQFRGWRDEDKHDRKAARQYQRSNTYYYSDAIANYYPVYRQPNYNYNQRPARENIVRSIISRFFAPEQAYYGNYSPSYQSYSPGYYQPQYQQPYYGGYNTPYYSQASYSPVYSSPYYGQGYDPYGNSPIYGTQLFGGSGLKSSILNIGLELLQGFLGQGYQQGRYQGQYARDVYGTRSNSYYDPYAPSEPAYYSPLASSFGDQRQLLDEGYRLGYQDAMMNRDPYGTGLGGGNVDIVSEFLSNALMNRI